MIFNRAVRDFVAGAPRTSHLGARDEPPAQGAVHLQPDRPRPRAARPRDRARAAQAPARPRRSTGSPSTRPRATSSAKASACTRSRSAWRTRAGTSSTSPASTTCRAFFALRTMDEIMVHNFMTFSDLMESEHYDLVIGDEAWDVDYYYHENPELKRQPFVFLTDFVGCLPIEERRARGLPVRRPQRRRHRARGALPVRARCGDLRRQPRGRDRAALRPRPAEHPRLDRPQLLLLRLRPAVRSRRALPTPSGCARDSATGATRRSPSPRSAAPASAGTCCRRSRRRSRA